MGAREIRSKQANIIEVRGQRLAISPNARQGLHAQLSQVHVHAKSELLCEDLDCLMKLSLQ